MIKKSRRDDIIIERINEQNQNHQSGDIIIEQENQNHQRGDIIIERKNKKFQRDDIVIEQEINKTKNSKGMILL